MLDWKVFALSLLLCTNEVFSSLYTSSGSEVSIPDANNQGAFVDIDIGSLNKNLVGSIETVSIVIHHTWPGDLTAYLAHFKDSNSTGVFVTLFQRVWRSSQGQQDGCPCCDIDVSLSMSYQSQVQTSCNPSEVEGVASIRGQQVPVGSLVDFKSETVRGKWRLLVVDSSGADTGSIVSWSINIREVNDPNTRAITSSSVTSNAISTSRLTTSKTQISTSSVTTSAVTSSSVTSSAITSSTLTTSHITTDSLTTSTIPSEESTTTNIISPNSGTTTANLPTPVKITTSSINESPTQPITTSSQNITEAYEVEDSSRKKNFFYGLAIEEWIALGFGGLVFVLFVIAFVIGFISYRRKKMTFRERLRDEQTTNPSLNAQVEISLPVYPQSNEISGNPFYNPAITPKPSREIAPTPVQSPNLSRRPSAPATIRNASFVRITPPQTPILELKRASENESKDGNFGEIPEDDEHAFEVSQSEFCEFNRSEEHIQTPVHSPNISRKPSKVTSEPPVHNPTIEIFKGHMMKSSNTLYDDMPSSPITSTFMRQESFSRLPRQSTRFEFQIGMICQALWADDLYYRVKIVDIQDDMYYLIWLDFDIDACWLPYQSLKLI